MANEINLEQACQLILGITSRRYRQMAAEDLVPPVIKGKIEIFKACKYLLEYYRKMAAGQGSMSLTDERVRITRLNADLKELQYKKLRGELIEVEKAMRLWGQVINAIRQKLLAMPVKLPPLIAGIKSLPQIKGRVDDFIREALVELANIELNGNSAEQGMESDRNNAEDVKAAAEIKGKRMGRRKKKAKS